MGVILLILKIIGVCVLTLLGILVFLLVFILTSHIRYCADFEKKDQLKAGCDIKWLIGILRVKIEYVDNEAEISVYIFGKKFYPKETKESEKKEKHATKKSSLKKTEKSESLKKFDDEIESELKKQQEQSQKAEKNKIPEVKETEKIKIEKPVIKNQKISQPIKRNTIKTEVSEEPVIKRIKINDYIKHTEETEVNTSTKKTSEKNNVKDEKNKHKKEVTSDVKTGKNEFNVKKSVEKAAEEVSDKVEELEEEGIKQYIKKMTWDDKMEVLSELARAIKKILKTVLPKAIFIKGKAGLGSPDYTGLLLAFGGILNGILSGECILEGDFDSVCFYGNVKAKGCFTLGRLLLTFIKLILDKPVRKLGLFIIRN